MKPNVIRSALLSECGLYRYSLMRRYEDPWPVGTLPGIVVWALNNPSKADGTTDDPTVNKLWTYTTSWG